MARKAFFSFQFATDHWRASTVRQIRTIEGSSELSDNDWEALKNTSDAAVKRWINGQMEGKSCTIVLIGATTAGRKWINYEIESTWALKKGIVGIRIHKLLNANQQPSYAGRNPFTGIKVGEAELEKIVKIYDPPGLDSKAAYKSISDNIDGLVEDAIKLRARY